MRSPLLPVIPLCLIALRASACVVDVELVHPPDAAGMPPPRWLSVPSSTGNDLAAIWGSSPNDIWAVGARGTAIHFNGTEWQPVTTNSMAALSGVWAASPTDAWSVGADASGLALYHWNGSQWLHTDLPAPGRVTMRAVWGSASDDVWAVGGSMDSGDPGVWHWDGGTWRPEFIPGGRPMPLFSVAGISNRVSLVGLGLEFYQHSPSGWNAPQMPPRGALFSGGMCVSADGAAWITSPNASVYRYAAGGWSTMTLPSAGPWRDLWCGQGGPWAVGDNGQIAHWNGTSWGLESAGRAGLAALWGTDTGTLWAVGAGGAVWRSSP